MEYEKDKMYTINGTSMLCLGKGYIEDEEYSFAFPCEKNKEVIAMTIITTPESNLEKNLKKIKIKDIRVGGTHLQFPEEFGHSNENYHNLKMQFNKAKEGIL